MGRKQEIQMICGELLQPVLLERLTEVQDYFDKHQESIWKSFLNEFLLLCRHTGEMQREKGKEAVQFLSISYVRRCIYTKQHEIRMDFYNKDFYLDPCKSYRYWDMGFLFQFFEKDIEYLWKHVRSCNPPILFGIQEYEEKEFSLWYVRHYYKIAEIFIRDQIIHILELEEFRELHRKDDFMILFGGYMEEQGILFPAEGGVKE